MQQPAVRGRRAVRFLFAVSILGLLAVSAGPGRALEDVRLSRPGIPWLQRVIRDGIALQVDLEPLNAPGGGELREKDHVAFRFRVYDTTTGQTLNGLGPVAWMGPVPEGEEGERAAVDPERCAAEAVQIVTEGAPSALREMVQPGTYETVTRLGRPGRYEVVFFLEAPRMVHCFQVEVRPRGRRG
jgi:hypothetical protein